MALAAIVLALVLIQVNGLFAVALLVLVPAVLLLWRAYRRAQRQVLIDQLREDWGRDKIYDRDLSAISLLHRLSQPSSDECVDDHSWADLNMDELFRRLDRTLTTPGACVLYDVLRRPLTDKQVLQDRARVVSLFQSEPSLRETVQMNLLGLGREQTNSITRLLWDALPAMSRWRILFSALALLSVTCVLLTLARGVTPWLAIVVVVFLVNMMVRSVARRRLLPTLPALRYLGRMIRVAQKMAAHPDERLAAYTRQLARAAGKAAGIARKTPLLLEQRSYSGGPEGFIYDYADILLLQEVRTFYAVLAGIHACLGDLRTIYRLLGELDALQGVASFRAGYQPCCDPIFDDRNAAIEMVQARHPLLANAIPNTVSACKKGLIITGSNMSGKTTLLRTIASNAILAQTISTCCCASYAGSLFRIVTSINDADSLLAGKSRFLIEAERMLKMLRLASGETAVLCVVDEVLAGTNPSERLAASREILRYLSSQNALVMVSTHDLQLAGDVQDVFECFHFTDNVDEGGLRFDFTLKPGISTTHNAIKILAYLGYPADIIARATKALTGESGSSHQA